MRDCSKSYPSCKPLSRQEELVMVEQFRNGATKAEREAARHQLLASITPFAYGMAKSMMWSGLAIDDLMQFAMIGADKGLERFNPSKGVRLLSYAAYWIRNAVQRGVADTSRTVHIPVQVWDINRKLCAAERRLLASGVEPTAELLAAEMKVPLYKVLWVLEGIRQSVATIDPLPQTSPLNSRLNWHGAHTEEFADPRALDPVERISKDRILRALGKAIDSLHVSERSVIERRFCESPMTLNEIGDAAAEWTKSGEPLSRERIRQIEANALRELRRLLLNDPTVSP
ncbi:sigma-70 family RNA polymerase sigma factor [Candidatus Uhrbacteria bacterium]|nr:sigma-70 family RNA polymerase sigma factor [Candidatus Uhrbacteria bacterium]